MFRCHVSRKTDSSCSRRLEHPTGSVGSHIPNTYINWFSSTDPAIQERVNYRHEEKETHITARERERVLDLKPTTLSSMAMTADDVSSTRWSSSNEILELRTGPSYLGDMVFGFLESGEEFPENTCNSGNDYIDEEEDEENLRDVEADRAFWEEQDQLIQAVLSKRSSTESKIRQAIKQSWKEKNLQCVCGKSMFEDCRNCLRREICNRLIDSGFDCSICKSKWKSSHGIPSGEHSYLEAVDKSNRKRGETRILIELNFRAEFEMARASEEYNKLIRKLPEVFVGKTDRLRALIKVLCEAAKKCMKEKKMHLGPWRKHKYMQNKWLGTCERSSPEPTQLPVRYSDRATKSRASMLTFDLLDAAIPGLHFNQIVEVV